MTPHKWRVNNNQVSYNYGKIRYISPENRDDDLMAEHTPRSDAPTLNQSTTMRSPTVVFGSFNQADTRFDPGHRNSQCTAMAMSAIMYSNVYPLPDWKEHDMNKVLLYGNQLYVSSLKLNNMPLKSFLAADEVFNELNIGSKLVKSSCITQFKQYMQFTSEKIKQNIHMFFNEHALGIVTCNQKSLALIKFEKHTNGSSQLFSVFDSHANSNKNKPQKSNLNIFRDVTELGEWFTDNHGKGEIYTITPVKVLSSTLTHYNVSTLKSKSTHVKQAIFKNIYGALGFDVNGKAIDLDQQTNDGVIDLERFKNMRHKCTEWMNKQGYSKGRGLGKNLQGKTEPVKAKYRRGKFGLGYVPTEKDLEDLWSGNNDESLKRSGNKISFIQFTQRQGKPKSIGIEENREIQDMFNIAISEGYTQKEKSCVFINVPQIASQVLPARVQTTMLIKIPEKGARVCVSQEIQPGVFIGNSIIQSDDGIAVVGVINNNEHAVSVEKVNIKSQPIHEFAGLKTNKSSANRDRIEQLTNIMKLNNREDNSEQYSLFNICENYSDLFLLPGERLTSTNARVFKLPLVENKIINLPQYRIPEKHKQEVGKQIDKLLRDDVIEPSISPFNSPLLLVSKKALGDSNEKLFRLCIDYRKLNKNLQPYQFPLPRIDEILDQLGNAKIFSTLDLSQGFHQIMIDKKDREKTAFSTAYGHYQYKRCPFGLKTLPGFFQSMLNSILTGLHGVTCFVYIDDVVVFAKDLEEHDKKLTDILNRFREYNLKLNPDKCHFIKKEIVYINVRKMVFNPTKN